MMETGRGEERDLVGQPRSAKGKEAKGTPVKALQADERQKRRGRRVLRAHPPATWRAGGRIAPSSWRGGPAEVTRTSHPGPAATTALQCILDQLEAGDHSFPAPVVPSCWRRPDRASSPSAGPPPSETRTREQRSASEERPRGPRPVTNASERRPVARPGGWQAKKTSPGPGPWQAQEEARLSREPSGGATKGGGGGGGGGGPGGRGRAAPAVRTAAQTNPPTRSHSNGHLKKTPGAHAPPRTVLRAAPGAFVCSASVEVEERRRGRHYERVGGERFLHPAARCRPGVAASRSWQVRRCSSARILARARKGWPGRAWCRPNRVPEIPPPWSGPDTALDTGTRRRTGG